MLPISYVITHAIFENLIGNTPMSNGLSRNALMLAKFHEWRIIVKFGFITDTIVIFNFIEVTTCNHMMNELNF